MEITGVLALSADLLQITKALKEFSKIALRIYRSGGCSADAAEVESLIRIIEAYVLRVESGATASTDTFLIDLCRRCRGLAGEISGKLQGKIGTTNKHGRPTLLTSGVRAIKEMWKEKDLKLLRKEMKTNFNNLMLYHASLQYEPPDPFHVLC